MVREALEKITKTKKTEIWISFRYNNLKTIIQVCTNIKKREIGNCIQS